MSPIEFLKLLWGNKPDPLYILIWTLHGKESHWFRHVDEAAKFVASHATDVYVGVGLSESDHGEHRRCTSEEVAGLAGLWADFDLSSKAHSTKPLPANVDEALSLIPPDLPPTIIISTGNGLHVWWLFKEPWIFENDREREAATALAYRFQTLSHYNSSRRGWAFDRLADLARVLRVPGTVNAKDPSNPKEVEVYSVEGRRYNHSEIAEYLDRLEIPDAETEERKAKQWVSRFEGEEFSINPDATVSNELLARWMQEDNRFRKTWKHERDDLRDASQSGYDLALANFGVRHGLEAQQIVDLITHHRRIHGAKRIATINYFKRAISKASTGQDHMPPVAIAGPDPRKGLDQDGGPRDPNSKAKLCDQISRILGVRILRLLKITGKDPLYLMELEDGSIEFPTVEKLISKKHVRTALAAKVGRLIPGFRPKEWENLAQMLLDACTIQEGTDDLDLEGEARLYVSKYLSGTQFIASPAGQPADSLFRPTIYESAIAISSTDMTTFINRTMMQGRSVKSVAAMLAALGSKTVRVRGQGFKEQSRWALPIEEFDPADYPQPHEDVDRE